ncbi:MAG TPA: hypothetical protein VJ878_02130, partial [Candidatus Izemoplasmatales bacterium]|nr:hypothetical protein [Candidatus Izemoplasmatales bacterium]
TNRQKKQQKLLMKYLIYMIESLDKIKQFYHKTMTNIHHQVIDIYADQIAMIKIHNDEEKQIIDNSFDQLDMKAMKQDSNYMTQQKLVKNKMKKLNQWMTHKGLTNNKTFEKFKIKTESELNYIKKKIIKLIHKNDCRLKKQMKLVHQDALNQYKQLMLDYKNQKNEIVILKNKIIEDHKVENQYIDYITNQRLQKIKQTKHILQRQLNTLPVERRTRLMNVDLQYEALFTNHQDILHDKLRHIERDKFVKVPLLEKKITQKENQVQVDFKNLYNKHQSLENEYLNQYTHINQTFRDLHNHFKEDAIKSTLGYDQALNQPLKDLINVQGSIINKTDIIYEEVSSKTQSKIKEIHKENDISQNKQSRIINS